MYYEAQKHFKGFGVNVEGVSYDWGQIQKQKDDAVSGLTKGIEGLFKKYKVRIRRRNYYIVIYYIMLIIIYYTCLTDIFVHTRSVHVNGVRAGSGVGCVHCGGVCSQGDGGHGGGGGYCMPDPGVGTL